MQNIWSKGQSVDEWMIRFTVGNDYIWDTILLPYDLEGTRAHAWGLTQIGILTADELVRINMALDELAADAASLTVTPQDEDCHTVIERLLTDKLGDLGKKIHTGRSRNDQVLTALRLYLKDALIHLQAKIKTFAENLCNLAEANQQVVMAGYTHYQRAMPSSVGLWAMGYAELLCADLEAMQAAFKQVDVSPLGSAAGYGVPYLDLPREAVAHKMGFSQVQTHVTTTQISRGKIELHVVHALMQVAATINRISSDLVLMNTAEFNAVILPKQYCTGSSIMPQKQNPDILEIARATYHRVLAEAHILMTLPANLPSGYHRDLQLTKEAVMRAIQSADDMLTAMNLIIPELRFNAAHLASQLSPDLFATADALERVANGTPFRDAYKEAAANVGNAAIPSVEEMTLQYRTKGTLGNLDIEGVRQRIRG
jgi:argininosuccinate lyase